MTYICPCGCGKPDECAPACRAKRVRYVCRNNGAIGKCSECGEQHPHRREEYAPVHTEPKCAQHGAMVPA